MQYMMLIYTDESLQDDATPADFEAFLQAHMAFQKETQDKGMLVHTAALQPTSTAKMVEVRQGKTTMTDGPYAETKEQIGGFYILNCADMGEALAYAAKLPEAQMGRIEVRPLVDLPHLNQD